MISWMDSNHVWPPCQKQKTPALVVLAHGIISLSPSSLSLMKPLPSSFGAIGSLVSVSLATTTKMSLPVLSLGASAESGILIIRQTLEEIYLAIGVFETCKAGVIHINRIGHLRAGFSYRIELCASGNGLVVDLWEMGLTRTQPCWFRINLEVERDASRDSMSANT